MTKTYRLDGWLAEANRGSRSECRKLIRKGKVSVDGKAEKRINASVNDDMRIEINGDVVSPPRRTPLTVIMA